MYQSTPHSNFRLPEHRPCAIIDYMKTPAGKDCPYYYADFHRGRHVQECRLADPTGATWQPSDCSRCTVPDILRANASPYLQLHLKIQAGILGIGRRLNVTATCDRHEIPIADPFVGCPKCNAEHPGLEAFLNALEQQPPPDAGGIR